MQVKIWAHHSIGGLNNMALYEQSKLYTRYLGIAKSYPQEVKDHEIASSMAIAFSILKSRYPQLSTFEKQMIGIQLGRIEKSCIELKALRSKITEGRVDFINRMRKAYDQEKEETKTQQDH